MKSSLWPAPGLLLARRGSSWVHVEEVPRGLACGCHCFHCGQPLIARKGTRRRAHFAHQRGAHCAVGSGESVLHRFAKWALSETRRLRTPAVYVHGRTEAVLGPRWQDFTHGYQEYAWDRWQIDLLLTKGRFRLGVEIAVEHPTGPAKQAAFARRRFPALEVDARATYREWCAQGATGGAAGLVELLVHTERHKRWLFHPYQHSWEYRQLQEAARRKVHHSVQGKYHHYLVYGCPLRRRFIRRGFHEGVAYARVFQDCLPCPHCRGIDYEQEWRAYRCWSTQPRVVFCGG